MVAENNVCINLLAKNSFVPDESENFRREVFCVFPQLDGRGGGSNARKGVEMLFPDWDLTV